MKLILFTFLCFVVINITEAQDTRKKFSNKFDDVIEEAENENLTLRFFNAITGDPIPGASVILFDEQEYTTDDEGKILFEIPENDGFITVKFTCKGFITSVFKVEVIAGTLWFNRFSVSPILDLKHIRIVLDWDAVPKDLDANFIKQNVYHISYRKTRVLADGTGELDRDDMDGFGPETITVKNVDDLATYEYVVTDFTNRANPNSKGLSNSKATVKVFAQGKLLYVFQIPQNGVGNNWSVFKLSEGQFVETNVINN